MSELRLEFFSMHSLCKAQEKESVFSNIKCSVPDDYTINLQLEPVDESDPERTCVLLAANNNFENSKLLEALLQKRMKEYGYSEMLLPNEKTLPFIIFHENETENVSQIVDSGKAIIEEIQPEPVSVSSEQVNHSLISDGLKHLLGKRVIPETISEETESKKIKTAQQRMHALIEEEQDSHSPFLLEPMPEKTEEVSQEYIIEELKEAKAKLEEENLNARKEFEKKYLEMQQMLHEMQKQKQEIEESNKKLKERVNDIPSTENTKNDDLSSTFLTISKTIMDREKETRDMKDKLKSVQDKKSMLELKVIALRKESSELRKECDVLRIENQNLRKRLETANENAKSEVALKLSKIVRMCLREYVRSDIQ